MLCMNTNQDKITSSAEDKTNRQKKQHAREEPVFALKLVGQQGAARDRKWISGARVEDP